MILPQAVSANASTGGGYNAIYTIVGPRTVQLAVKLLCLNMVRCGARISFGRCSASPLSDGRGVVMLRTGFPALRSPFAVAQEFGKRVRV
jgi:hypothetical protein